MNLESISFLYRYNIWATDRILAAAGRVTPEQFTARVPFLGEVRANSLRNILVHTLSAEWVWRSRVMLGISPPALLPFEDFPDVLTLAERWREESETMRYYIAGLTSIRLQDPVSYTTTSGAMYTTPRWQILTHVVLHGTQHRSEAAAVLTAYGASPGDIDLIHYIRLEES
jgi:uncharacterized damage-inducible protein DinB